MTTETNQLKARVTFLEALIENSKDMLYRMRLPQGNYEFVSAAATEITGYAPEEFYHSPGLIQKIIHPDWHDYFKVEWDKLIKGDMPPFYEYQIVHKAGDVRWIHQKNVLIKDDQGNPAAIEGIVSDITERKLMEQALKFSERRLKDAQEMARLGHWHWDVHTGRVEWSREVYRIFHLDPEEFTPEIDSILKLSPWPEENKRDRELIDKAIKSRETGTYEQRFLYPDGSIGHYFSTFQGIYDDKGELQAIYGTIQDITERKKAEEDKSILEEKYRQARKVEAIGRLAGGVAHDLNNLLSPVLGYAEMLLEDLSKEAEHIDYLNEIILAAKRAKNLVGQLLAFGRKQTLNYKNRDMNAIVSGVTKLLRQSIRENIEIRTRLSPSKQIVSADTGQIEQVILNLAINAQDAMVHGGTLTIDLGARHISDTRKAPSFDGTPGDHVMLSIADTGHGMDEATKAQIFEPFFSTKGQAGTGLGLATVYGIVKQHGGAIDVESTPGAGTIFRIYLPARGNEEEDPEALPPTPGRPKGSETILLVEDNGQARRLFSTTLKKLGYTILEAENGQEALTHIETAGPAIALLITDVIMPGMNGRDLYTKALKLTPGLKVLYISGYPDDVLSPREVAEEGIRFLQKPFTTEKLAEKIRGIIDGSPRFPTP